MEYYFTYFVVFKSNDNGLSGPIVLFKNLESAQKNNNGLSTLFQTNFFRLFFRYCTGV